jgi:hypothetical protein
MRGLHQRRPSCILIETPPGCEDQPDAIGLLQRFLSEELTLYNRCACIAADSVADDGEFIDSIVREWLFKEPLKKEVWEAEQGGLKDLPVVQRLKAFFSICLTAPTTPRVLLVRRFDRIFRGMSGELLAVLRDLEHEMLLISINSSPLTYEELYRRRSRSEPGFTSDYGQTHVRLTIGPLLYDEAKNIWTEQYGLPLETRFHRAHFETAYSLSGGLPAAFAKAAAYTLNFGFLDKDLRLYRLALMEQLPSVFERLLRYDDDERASKLINSIAKIYIGAATPLDDQIATEHRWKSLLVKTETYPLQVICEALGRKALEMLRSSKTTVTIQPEILYQEGQYLACVSVLKGAKLPYSEAFLCAANMMAEVFGDAPGDLYFSPKINWQHVEQYARRGAKECVDKIAQSEFERWIRISEIHKVDWDNIKRNDSSGKGNISAKVAEDTAIRLAIRVLAIQRDTSPVTAAYAAIPLVEDVLRNYIVFVAELPLDSKAFSGIDETMIKEWWKEKKTFKLPEGNAPLNVTHLAVLAAVISARRKAPLFDNPEGMSRLFRVLDEGRNRLGHYVIIPSEQLSRSLVEHAASLLDRIYIQIGSDLSIEEVSNWVRPPKYFLSASRG